MVIYYYYYKHTNCLKRNPIFNYYLLTFDLIVDESLTGKRLVWPEQLPFGDRMRDQINYVPEGYAYEKTPVKTILIYTGLGEDWEKPRLGQAEFFGCAVNQCLITVNRTFGPDVDAVLFRHSYSRPSFKRPPNQVSIPL